MVPMLRVLLLLLAATSCLACDWYLFTSFRRNGETGVYFAVSEDGRRWTPLKSNQPWITPQHAGMLMRDPFSHAVPTASGICCGPGAGLAKKAAAL